MEITPLVTKEELSNMQFKIHYSFTKLLYLIRTNQ